MILSRKTNLVNAMPAQKVSSAKKTDDWKKDCVDAIQTMSTNNTGRNGRSSKAKKQSNYDLVNSIINKDEVSYVTDPIGIGSIYGDMPAKMQSYNKIREDLYTLLGEETLRPFNWMVIGVNGEVITAKEEMKKNAVLQNLTTRILRELGLDEPQIDPQTGQEIEPPTPEQAAKYSEMSYKDIREKVTSQLLNYLIDKERLQAKFAKGLEHLFIASEEIYYIGISDGHPRVRVVNPLFFDFDKSSEAEFIQDSQWAREERWLTIGEVLDLYSEYLTDEEIDKLESGDFSNFGYTNNGFNNRFAVEKIEQNGGIVYDADKALGSVWNGGQYSGGDGYHIYVCNVTWRSMKKIGFLLYKDENGEAQETIVSEDFKLTAQNKKDGWAIEFRWIPEVWQGTKIGDDIYVNVAPLPNQVNGKLPYVGYVYGNLNSQAMSWVDHLAPHQHTYNIIWYRMEKEIAKSKGKVLELHLDKLPKNMSLDQVLYYIESMGIIMTHNAEEGLQGNPTQGNTDLMKTHDLSMSRVVGEYIQVLSKLEEAMSGLSGVSRQRKGNITSSETVGGVQTSIVTSSNTTEPYFFRHNEVKKEVLNQLLQVAQIAYINGKKLHNVVDEIYTEVINIDGEMLNDSDFEVRLSNSTKDQQRLEKLENLAQAALQNDKLRFSDIITIIESSSLAEIKSLIRKGEKEQEKRAQQNADADRQMQKQISDDQIQAQQDARIFEAEQNQLDRDNDLAKAQITAYAFDKSEDVNKDGQADIVGQLKVVVEQNKAANQHTIETSKLQQEQQKMELEAAKVASDASLKQEELRIKEKDSDNKLKIAKANKNRFSK